MDAALRFVGLVTVAAIGALLACWPWLRARRDAWRTHCRLAAASGLTDRERRWLWRVASETCPDQPALVFVRPSLLEVGLGAASPDLARAVGGKLYA